MIAWGTGLGPITGNDAAVPVSTDLGTPVTVYVGGVQANVTYRGRSAEPGLDQVNFVVPQGVTGCYVSLVVQTGAMVSNTTTLAIANGGGACSDPNGIPLSSLSGTLQGNGSLRLGLITLFETSVTTTALGSTQREQIATGSAAFEKLTAPQLAASGSLLAQPSVGSCSVSVSFVSLSSPSGLPSSVPTPAPTPVLSIAGLDAGPSISLTPASGMALSLAESTTSKGAYSSASISSLPAGAIKIANGSGGADVGAFTANLNVPAALQWTNETAVTSSPINRSSPLQFTGSGGDSKSYVFIEGISFTVSGNNEVGGYFACVAPIAAGQFTVSPSVLLSLPATNTGALFSTALMILGTTSQPLSFSATGLDAGYVIVGSAVGDSVNFQ